MSALSSTTSTLGFCTGPLRGRERPQYGRRGPGAHRAPQRDLSPVASNDLRDDGQPQAGPLAALLGGEVGIEDGVQTVGRNPHPMIANLQAEMPRFGGVPSQL